VEPLSRALNDENVVVRSSAAENLRRIGDARAVDALCTALGDADSLVRGWAVDALANIGDLRAIESLIKALSNGNLDVRAGASEALVMIRNPQAVEALCNALGCEDMQVRIIAADILGKCSDARAVVAPCRSLADEHLSVRTRTAAALRMIGDRDQMPRNILLQSGMSSLDRELALNALRSAFYYEDNHRRQYKAYNAHQYCVKMKLDADIRVRKSAEVVLCFLADKALLRPSNRDEAPSANELVRGISSDPAVESGHYLLRGSEAAQVPAEGALSPHRWFQLPSLGVSNKIEK